MIQFVLYNPNMAALCTLRVDVATVVEMLVSRAGHVLRK